eukprot:CAMPEP_0170069276 /NCGR_PEP_ID=MMETSP0019_2-20121128/8008_1 /TAXON_ID=98059 /ORGANISM="Dinobryon sp., Strain UTEXLB2267" /LENGTH=416 /DNA_ID=CAMNT_0010277273 /DNA_START=102 /DNA_END=1352 /DNA_ORIENTATION=+
MSEAENIQVYVRIRPANCDADLYGPESIPPAVRCVYQVDDCEIKVDCERCAKASFAEFMPSATMQHSPLNNDHIPPARRDCPDDALLSVDGVFSESSDCEDMFSGMNLQRNVSQALQGHVSTVLALGAAASGKTHSMFGQSPPSGLNTKEDGGLAALLLQEVFRQIEQPQPQPVQYFVELSLVELAACHGMRSLLRAPQPRPPRSPTDASDGNASINSSPRSHMDGSMLANHTPKKSASATASAASHDAELFDSASLGVFLSGGPGLKVRVQTAEEALAVVRAGLALRTCRRASGAGEPLHYLASRSHVVLSVYIESKQDLPPPNTMSTTTSTMMKRTKKFLSLAHPLAAKPAQQLRLGRLQLVDLAGGSGGQGARGSKGEEAFISLSLHALGETEGEREKERDVVAISHMAHIVV